MTSTQLHQAVQEEKVKLMSLRTTSVSTSRQIILPEKPMPFAPDNTICRFGLISLIAFATIIIAYFSAFWAIVALVMAILGFAAGKLR